MDNAFASAGNLAFVSEQQFADYDTTVPGCNGDNAFATAEKNGICTEASCTYRATGGACSSSSCTVGLSHGGVVSLKDFDHRQ